MQRTLTIPAVALAVSIAGALAPAAFQAAPPVLQVDPLWPKPLPNHWLLGPVTGVAVDARDRIWAVHRGYDSMMTRASAPTIPRRRPSSNSERRCTARNCRMTGWSTSATGPTIGSRSSRLAGANRGA